MRWKLLPQTCQLHRNVLRHTLWCRKMSIKNAHKDVAMIQQRGVKSNHQAENNYVRIYLRGLNGRIREGDPWELKQGRMVDGEDSHAM